MLSLLKTQPVVPVLISDKESNKKSVWAIFKKKENNVDLYFGGQYNSRMVKKLKALDITAIVDMRSQIIHLKTVHNEFKYLHLPTLDNSPPDLELLIKGADFIEEEIKNGGKVYINCLKGLGRGPTLTIAYLMKTGKTFEEAYSRIKSLRPEINLSIFQVMKLQELEAYFKNNSLQPLQDEIT